MSKQIVLGLILLFSPIANQAVAHTADKEKNTVAVNGQCSREATPDRGSLTVTAEADGKTPAVAKSVTKLYEKIRAEIKKLGLKDMQLNTSSFIVTPQYSYERNRPSLIGYKARMGLTVETSEISRLGEVIEIAAQNGVQRVSSLNAFLSVKKLQEEQEACLEEAVRNARMKAEKMVKAAGGRLGGVVSLSESGGIQAVYEDQVDGAESMAMAQSKGEAAPAVETRKRDISISVQAVFLVL